MSDGPQPDTLQDGGDADHPPGAAPDAADPQALGTGTYRVLDTVEEYYAHDLDDFTTRLRTALRQFPELAGDTVTVARDAPNEDRNAGAWPWSRIVFIPDDKRVSNVTIYHELGHIAIQCRVERGADLPTTSERFCSIFSMARMPTVRVDEARIPYLDSGDVSRGLYPIICQTALRYREHRHDYIKQCERWLQGEWNGRETIAEVAALE